MKKIDSHPPEAYQMNARSVVSTFPSVPANTALGTLRRLIVLLPFGIDYGPVTRRIWEFAQASGMDVLLLGLCEDRDEEPSFRRGLVNMASLLEDSKICAEVKVDTGTNWMAIVKDNYKAGDAIVCFAEQRSGLLHRPLSQILEASFKATVYILSSPAPQKTKTNGLAQVGAWLGFIAIIVGFGMLQASIVQLPQGWIQGILLTLSILPEFWLIWVWNSRFR